MDMKANLGSFGAALKTKDLWVMNVVPEDGPNTLKLIYDRGLIGSIHNWYVFPYLLLRYSFRPQLDRTKLKTMFHGSTWFASSYRRMGNQKSLYLKRFEYLFLFNLLLVLKIFYLIKHKCMHINNLIFL